MSARIVREKSARWQVIVPWQRGQEESEVVAAEIVTSGSEVGIKMIGSQRMIGFPLERAKMLLAALQEAIASMETST